PGGHRNRRFLVVGGRSTRLGSDHRTHERESQDRDESEGGCQEPKPWKSHAASFSDRMSAGVLASVLRDCNTRILLGPMELPLDSARSPWECRMHTSSRQTGHAVRTKASDSCQSS